MVRALPKNLDRQKEVVRSLSHSLGITPAPKGVRAQAAISDANVQKVQKFYELDSVSWQAPGKRDTKTVRENGVKMKRQKRHLLYNVREVYALFIAENPGENTRRLFEFFFDRVTAKA